MSPSSAGPLGAAETERIAALLAEVMPHAAPILPPTLPPDAVTQSLRSVRKTVAQHVLPVPQPSPPEEIHPTLVGEAPEPTDWPSESPRIAVDESLHESDDIHESNAHAEPGPLPAPFGVLTVSELFGLVNWRNRPDDVRPLPLITPPPPPKHEHTVAAMMPMFGWEH